MTAHRSRWREWLARYGPAEGVSLLTTFLPAWYLLHTTGNRAAAAFVGTWAGNAGYFGTILWADIRRARRACQAAGRSYTIRTLGRNLRALAAEFGLAEVLDSFLIRPALLYYLPLWLGRPTLGLLLAKAIADGVFYVPVLVSYEWSKRCGWRRFS